MNLARIRDLGGFLGPTALLILGCAPQSADDDQEPCQTIELADVTDGIGGFAMDGETGPTVAGNAVSRAGDVNGDGLADVIVGAQLAGPNAPESGRSYVVFGKADTDRVSLADVVGGIGGFAMDGEAEEDRSGFRVSSAGDVNGDGLDDVIVGARMADPNGLYESGRAYVVFGKADTEAIQLADVAQGNGGFAMDGEVGGALSGSSVSSAGDVNGDGLDDLIVGAHYADANGLERCGRAYVVFGKTDTDRVLLEDVAQGVGGFALDGEGDSEYAGKSVSGAGDVNGDGLADVIVGATGANPKGFDSGRVYVVFGKADTDNVSLVDVAQGDGGFAIDGETEDYGTGRSVSGAGDVNGDGLVDFVVGAPDAQPTDVNNTGRIYVVFGKEDTETIQLADVFQGIGGFAMDGDTAWGAFGLTVSDIGDFNSDGLADVLTGAYEASPNGSRSGRTYVIFGKEDTEPVSIEDLVMGLGGFVIDGEAAEDQSGLSVSGTGDVNGDGLPDIVVGAPEADPNGSRSGRTYVFFGNNCSGELE
jgi:hypothetical protein